MRASFIGALIVALVMISPAAAQNGPASSAEDFEQKAAEAAQRMLGALAVLFKAIPQYEAPELLENGDIIVRRKPPPDQWGTRPVPEEKGPPAGTCECSV